MTMDFLIENGVLNEYRGPGGDISIPAGVTGIGNEAFKQCESLTGVTLPEGVTDIGERAFYRCKKLRSVTLPEGVTDIGKWAFGFCKSLKSIQLPEGVTRIGGWAFCFCTGLNRVSLPESLRSIGPMAFNGCPGLTGITLPFISSGGSSLVVSFMLMSLLLCISGNISWKGQSSEEIEFFEKSTDCAKRIFASGHRHVRGLVPDLRPGAGSLPGGRPAKSRSKAGGV